jgi:hypothetical protein
VPRINWGRVVAGGIVAAIIGFLSDGFLHEVLLNADWKAVYAGLGVSEPKHSANALAYFAVFELGRGLIALVVYAGLRASLGPGPKTAAIAGVVSWFAFSVTGPVQFIPLGFFSHALWVKAGLFQLVTSVVATIAGAALYREP